MSVHASDKQPGGSLITGIDRTGSVELYRISGGIVVESAGPNGGKRTQVAVQLDDLIAAIRELIDYELVIRRDSRVPSNNWDRWEGDER